MRRARRRLPGGAARGGFNFIELVTMMTLLPILGGVFLVLFFRAGARPVPAEAVADSVVAAPSAADVAALETLTDPVTVSEIGFPVTHFSRRLVPLDGASVEMERTTDWVSLLLTLVVVVAAFALVQAWVSRQQDKEERRYMLEAVSVTVLVMLVVIALVGLVGTLATGHRVVVGPEGIEVEKRSFFFLTSTTEISREQVAGIEEDRVVRVLYRTEDGEVGWVSLPVSGPEGRRVAALVRAALGPPS